MTEGYYLYFASNIDDAIQKCDSFFENKFSEHFVIIFTMSLSNETWVQIQWRELESN